MPLTQPYNSNTNIPTATETLANTLVYSLQYQTTERGRDRGVQQGLGWGQEDTSPVTKLPITPITAPALSHPHPHCQKAPGWPFQTSQERMSLPRTRRSHVIHQEWQDEVTLRALNTLFPAPAHVKEPEWVSGASALVQTQPLLL